MRHSEVLGVAPEASADEIQTAFRKAAMEVHPDHSDSPEAAEAFRRIKEARDELMTRARASEAARDDAFVQRATDAAVRASTSTAYQNPVANDDDLFAGMSPEEIAHVQMLDDLVYHTPKRRFFRHETDEVIRHRKTLQTGKARINGKY